MGAVSGLLGTAGGASGTGFAAPSSGGGAVNPFQKGEAPQQVTNSLTQNQGALGQQQQLLYALQAQNGIQNQSDVYNQLQGVVNGQGPNPAQAMLNQATGQNVANQAALMAGQRGANANVGLIARQAAQQGANTQQQAVGQGATLQANQSLNALGQAGNLAGTQAANQIGAQSTYTQAQQNNQQELLNALAGYSATNAGLQANINSANASLANTTMAGQQSLIGGGLQAAGSALGLAAGGDVQHFDGGGQVTQITAPQNPGPQSAIGKYLVGEPMQMPNWAGSMDGDMAGAKAMQQGFSDVSDKISDAAKYRKDLYNTTGSAGVLPGAGYVSQESPPVGTKTMAASSFEGPQAAQGGMMTHDYRGGGNVKAKKPQEKAVASGNNYANDKIPAMLSEGEVVIPRSVMQSGNPVAESAKFVQSVLNKRKAK